MAKTRSSLVDYLVYLAVRLFVCLIQALSFRGACHLARLLAWVLYHVDGRHRRVADENLRLAFPGTYTDAERDKMVRRVYRHFCTMLMEIIHLPRCLHTQNWKEFLEVTDGRVLVEALLSGRPLLIVTGHFGNWEVAGYAMALFGFKTHAIARPLDNLYLDNYLRSFRERTGQRILAKHGDFARMQDVLDSAGVLATLADQDAGQRGLFVNFFGRPASTHKAVALLALEHRVPLAVAGVPRVQGKYRILIADVIYPEEYDNNPNALQEITQRFTTGLESLIRQYPEQYFWLHRRWKSQRVRTAKRPAA
jgi:KDO2-lipid IV(A) lauroyltransferase